MRRSRATSTRSVAGEVRRRRDVVYEFALVSSNPDALERLESSPTVVAIVERSRIAPSASPSRAFRSSWSSRRRSATAPSSCA